MKIVVKTTQGQSFDLDVFAEETVEAVKVKLANQQAAFPAERQHLIYAGTLLRNEQRVKDTGVKAGDAVYVMVTKAKIPPTSTSSQAPAAAQAPAPAAQAPAPRPAAPAPAPRPAAPGPPQLLVQRNREWLAPELAWPPGTAGCEYEVQEERQHGLPAHSVSLVDKHQLPLKGLARQGGKRRFRLRCRPAGGGSWSTWSPWCEVDSGPFSHCAVKVFAASLPSLDKGWGSSQPEAAGISLQPLEILHVPSNTTLAALAEAAKDVLGLEGAPDHAWLAEHLPLSEWGERASAVVPGEPPELNNAGLVLILGSKVIRVPVLGLERLELRDFQPSAAEWELKVALTGLQGLGAAHCLAISEVDGELLEGPQVHLEGSGAHSSGAFADYTWLDGGEPDHDSVVRAILEGTRLPILVQVLQPPVMRVEEKGGELRLVWDENEAVVHEVEEERPLGMRPLLATIFLQSFHTLHRLEALGGTRRFRIRSLCITGAWSKWSEWLQVDSGPAKLVEVHVYSDIPGLLADVRWWGQYPELQVGKSYETLELEPVAVLQLPSTTTMEEVVKAAAQVDRAPGEPSKDWILRNQQQTTVEEKWGPNTRRHIRTPGAGPATDKAAFVVLFSGFKDLKVPLVGLQDLELRDLLPASGDLKKVVVTTEATLGPLSCLMISTVDGSLNAGPAFTPACPHYMALRSGRIRQPLPLESSPQVLKFVVEDTKGGASSFTVSVSSLLEQVVDDFARERGQSTQEEPDFVVLPISHSPKRVELDRLKIPLACFLGVQEPVFTVVFKGAPRFQVLVHFYQQKRMWLTVEPSWTVEQLQWRIQEKSGIPPAQQRLIHRGRQLMEDQRLADFGVVALDTIFGSLRLRGPLPYSPALGSPGDSILKGNRSPTVEEVKQVVEEIGGDLAGDFLFFRQMPGLSPKLATKLRKLLDDSCGEEEDFELFYVPEAAKELFGAFAMSQFAEILGSQPDEVRLRRVAAHRRVMRMHLDEDEATVQVPLNDPEEYQGGELIYLNSSGLTIAPRPCLSATRHDNRVVHGVAELQGGVRYSMYLLKMS